MGPSSLISLHIRLEPPLPSPLKLVRVDDILHDMMGRLEDVFPAFIAFSGETSRTTLADIPLPRTRRLR